MPRGTKKVGIAGRFGARYGVKIRRRAREVLLERSRWHPCPQCNEVAVKRVSSGVWRCRRCDYTFAGGAYRPVVTTAVTRQIAVPTTGEETAAEGEA
jgi:large subunit ribosomal protein L37Ae